MISEVFTKEFQTTPSPIITQVYSLKFLISFRLQIPVQFLQSVIDMLIQIINQSEKVCQNACLITLEKLLLMKDLNTSELLSKNALNNQNTFTNLTNTIIKLISTECNIFAIRCLYRSLILTNPEFFKSIMPSLTTTLHQILKNIMLNSTQDEFNYFFFEICSFVMTKISSFDIKMVTQFENTLRSDLTLILSNSITDLMGYVFQFFSLYINLSNDTSEHYNKLLQSILFDLNSWNLNMKYMFSPFVAFLKVYLMKNQSFFSNQGIVDQIFKICEKLLTLKSFNQIFEILDYLLNCLNGMELINPLTNFLGLIYKTILENKTSNPKVYRDLGTHLLLFISKMVIKLQCEAAIQIVTKIGGGINLLVELINLLPAADSVEDKKLIFYSYSLILTSYISNIPEIELKQIAKIILSELPLCYSFTLRFMSKKNEDISYAARNYNRLVHATVNFSVEDYKNIYKMEPAQIIFTAASAILEKHKINLINLVFNEMNQKDKNYIKNYAQKFNFPL